MEQKTAQWYPASKPQWKALLSQADELFYGGAAGGGKSALIVGAAIECHTRSVIFRRVYPNLKGIMSYARKVIGTSARENKSDKIWSWPDGEKTLEFGAVQYEDNKTDWQGRPHDLKAFDEITEFTESQYVFICGWNRSEDPDQRVRVIVTGNPPINESGSWVLKRWGAWLDRKHPRPAKDGELRWYATVDGEEMECPDGQPFEHKGETIYPRSRTFIRSSVKDNPYYAHDTHYLSVLQSLPEPLRSQMLNGDFDATQGDDPWQVIPTAWVLMAQERWRKRNKPDVPLSGAGLDPSRGGADKASLAKRYDNWFDEVVHWPGKMVPTGPALAALVNNDLSPLIGDGPQPYINVDVVGVGSSPFDSLTSMFTTVYPVNGDDASEYRDRSGRLKMRNRRAEMYWRMHDALDPEHGDDLALPPDPELLADLCSTRYEVTTAGVIMEDKEKVRQRIGRSPDVGEAVLMALYPYPSETNGVVEYYRKVLDDVKRKKEGKK